MRSAPRWKILPFRGVTEGTRVRLSRCTFMLPTYWQRCVEAAMQMRDFKYIIVVDRAASKRQACVLRSHLSAPWPAHWQLRIGCAPTARQECTCRRHRHAERLQFVVQFYAASDYVIWEDDMSTEMYFIVEGMLEVRINFQADLFSTEDEGANLHLALHSRLARSATSACLRTGQAEPVAPFQAWMAASQVA